MQEIADWLAKLGMSEYAERFAENRIDCDVLPDLTDEDLKHIGVVLGDRRKILRAIASLDAAPDAMVAEPKPASSLSFAAVQGLPTEEGASERGDVTLYDIVRETGGGHPRSNYHRLIARAVKGLDRSSAEARQLIYERARKALIAHLRFNQPGLPKEVIVKERLALEDAIRKIEAEATRKSRTEIPPEPARWPAVHADPGEQPLSQRPSMEREAETRFREVVREVHDFDAATPRSMQTAPHTREAYEEEAIEPIVVRVRYAARAGPRRRLWAGRPAANSAPARADHTRHGTRSRADARLILVRRVGDTSRGADYARGIGGSSFLGMVCD